MGDGNAREKLARHSAQTRAGGATGVRADFAGLVVPQYLVDMAQAQVANRSNFRDACHSNHPLPSQGMEFEIAKGTSTSADEQSAELGAVETTQLETEMLPVAVHTYTSGQVLSRQSVERGQLEQFVVNDMQLRLATKVDNDLLNAATHGALDVANDTPFEGTTQEDLYAAISAAMATVEKATGGDPATHVVMDSDLWGWFQGYSTPNHPMVGNTVNAMSDNAAPYGPGVRGVLPNGLKVVVTNNYPLNNTTKHGLLLVPQAEAHLWEDSSQPVLLRAEQPLAANLAVQLVLYSYLAYSYERRDDALASISAIDIAPSE